MPRLLGGASCHRPCGGGLRGGGLFISVPFVVVCLMAHYTRPTYVVQIEPTQTTPKPLQTLAFIGVSQPHDGDTKTADTTATAATITATARPCTTATARHTTDTARTSRHDHRDDVTTHAIAPNNDHARANITRHAKTQPNKRSNVAPCNKHPRGGVSPRVKKPGPLAL